MKSSSTKRASRRSRYLGDVSVRHKSRRSRSRTGRSGWEAVFERVGLRALIRPGRIVARVFRALQTSSLLLTLPFSVILAITATDFLVLLHFQDVSKSLFYEALPVPYDDPRRTAVEIIKSNSLAVVYVFTLVMALLNWRAVLQYVREWPHLGFLVVYLLLGVTYSIDPLKVFTNTIIASVAITIAILFSISHAEQRRFSAFYAAVLLPMLFVQIAGFIILVLYDTNVIEFIGSPRRYGGLAGNPNSLGATAVLGVWAGSCLALSPNTSTPLKTLGVVGVLLSLFSIALSGSGTAVATVIILSAILGWMKLLSSVQIKTRSIINIMSLAMVVLLLMSIMLFVTPSEIYLSFTEGLGKDATLSGRTELWSIARDAIAQRPILGWGYDSHASVKAERAFEVRFNHYHNGFLDTMVAGGVVLLGIVIYNLTRFSYEFFHSFRRNAAVFPLIMPLVIIVLLNLSEYSLLRPGSQQWLIYLTAFVLLTFGGAATRARRRSSRSSSTGSGGGERLRWA